MPLVSVVVPFYNVRAHARRCVDSLLAQTFRDYELVLVDDGSTDGTAELLDGYVGLPNVRVLHKENGGLSHARNYGVAASTGELVTFVDGDDFVAPFYLEGMVSAMPPDSSAIVSGGFVVLPEGAEGSFTWRRPEWRSETLGREAAMREIAYEGILASACGKLAPRSVYESVPFPEGCYYEEISTVCSFYESVDLAVLLEPPAYAYVMHAGSIVNRRRATVAQALDYAHAISVVDGGLRAHESSSPEGARYHTLLQCSRLEMLLGSVSGDGEAAELLGRYVRAVARSTAREVASDPRVSLARKAEFALLALSPRAYRWAHGLYDGMAKGLR